MDAKKTKKILYDKRTIFSIYIVSFVLLIFVIAFSVSLDPAAFVADDGGGGGGTTYISIDPINIPIIDDVPIIPIYPDAPDAPELMNIFPYNDLDGEILLLWTFVYETTTYELYRSKDGGSYQLIETILCDIVSYNDIVYDSGIYKYKILAEGVGGSSDFSNEQTVTVDLLFETPIEPPPNDTTDTTEFELNIIIGLTILGLIFLITLGFIYTKKKRGNR